MAVVKRLYEAVDEHLGWMETQYSRNTVVASRTALTLFKRSVGDFVVKNITSAHVDKWMQELSGRVSPTTMTGYLMRVKQFCRWARARKYVPAAWDPIGFRRQKKVVPKGMLYIPVARFSELLDATDCPRDRAAVAFGLYTLGRVSEMRLATVADVDLESGWLDMQIQKSGKRDRMPMSVELQSEMGRWLGHYRDAQLGRPAPGPTRLEGHNYLFPPMAPTTTRDAEHRRFQRSTGLPLYTVDKPVSYESLHMAIQHAIERLGYPTEHAGGHTLRRSGARARFDHLRSLGYDGALRDVQSLLHHSSIQTTERYLGLTLEVTRRDESIRAQAMYGSADRHPASVENTAGKTRRLRIV